MALIVVKNKLDQEIRSDYKVGGITLTPLTFTPLGTVTIGDNEVGPTMSQQIANGRLQIVSTVASVDPGSGFVAALNLAVLNSRVALSLVAGEYFTLERLLVQVVSADTVTADAEISVGVTGPGYDDLVVSKTLTQVRAVGDTCVEVVEGKGEKIVGPADILVAVKTAALAVALTADVYVFGSGS